MTTTTRVVADADRLVRAAEITGPALARFNVQEVLDDLLGGVRHLLGTDTAAVLLLSSRSGQLVATAASGLEEEVRLGTRIPVGAGFAGRIAAEKRPVILDNVRASDVVNPLLLEKGIRSLLGVPLLAGGAILGVLHVGSLTARDFTLDDVQLLEIVAERVALALRLRLIEMEQAAALQQSLLPEQLPVRSGLEFAAQYVPSEGGGGVGGDWYDVFPLASGGLGLVIGDVVGRGLNAALVMGRLRSALRACALDGDPPATVLDRLDRDMQQFEPGLMATVLYATLDGSAQRLHIATAGHPLPMLAYPGAGGAVQIDIPIDPPIGVTGRGFRRTSVVDLPDGAIVFFYTDGLIESRSMSIDVGLRKLKALVTPMPAASLCATTVTHLIGADPPGDDVTVLAMRRCS